MRKVAQRGTEEGGQSEGKKKNLDSVSICARGQGEGTFKETMAIILFRGKESKKKSGYMYMYTYNRFTLLYSRK